MRISKPLFISLFSCLFAGVAVAQVKEVMIRLAQDDNVYPVTANSPEITLQNKSFKIQVMLQNIPGVYLFASLGDSLFRLPDDQPVPGFEQLPYMAMAESVHNKEKELLIDDHGWCYWYYDPLTLEHRFNKKLVYLDSGQVVGIKTIKQVFFVDRRKNLKLKELGKPLFLFFVAVEKEDPGGIPRKELSRWKLKINWREED